MISSCRRSTKNCSAFLAGTPIYTQWGHIVSVLLPPGEPQVDGSRPPRRPRHTFRGSFASSLPLPPQRRIMLGRGTALPMVLQVMFKNRASPMRDKSTFSPKNTQENLALEGKKKNFPVVCYAKIAVDMKAESTYVDISIVEVSLKNEMNETVIAATKGHWKHRSITIWIRHGSSSSSHLAIASKT